MNLLAKILGHIGRWFLRMSYRVRPQAYVNDDIFGYGEIDFSKQPILDSALSKEQRRHRDHEMTQLEDDLKAVRLMREKANLPTKVIVPSELPMAEFSDERSDWVD